MAPRGAIFVSNPKEMSALKSLLLNNVQEVANLQEQLDALGIEFVEQPESEQRIYHELCSLLEKYPANPLVLKKAMQLYQLSNDPIWLSEEELSLGEIETCYLELLKELSTDIEIWQECFHFLYAVMDKEEEAEKIKDDFKILIKDAEKEFMTE